MHIVIIGCGKVGSKFAQILSEEGHDVVIVDSDSSMFKLLGPDFNGITVTGVPIDQDVLRQAGIENADALAAVTPDDNINIMACQVAKEFFKVPRVIARIYNPERERVFHLLGLETICPTNLTVNVIKSIVLDESKTITNTIACSTLNLKQIDVDRSMVGKTLGSVKVKSDSSVFGIIKNGSFEFAEPNIKIELNDRIVIAEKID